MPAFSCATLRYAPRRICFIISSANQRSTRLSHDPYVGAKCTWKPGRLANQFRTRAVLWVVIAGIGVRLCGLSGPVVLLREGRLAKLREELVEAIQRNRLRRGDLHAQRSA